MRILHVIDSLGRGGAEQVVTTLAKAQSRVDTVGVVSLFPPNALEQDLRGAGIEVFPLNLGAPHRLAHTALALRRVVHAYRPSVLHAHLTFSLLAVGVVPLLGARRVGTFHNLGLSSGRRGGLRTRLLRGLLGAVVRLSYDELTAVSTSAAVGYQRELGLGSPPVVIPNPVDIEALRLAAPANRQVARGELRLSDSRPLLVCVAKFTWEKGHDVLFEAMASLPDRQRPRLALVGDGPLREQLRARALELGLERDLVWCGERPHRETLAWMTASNGLVLPSRAEGQPVTVLEAMALRVPVVATSVGGVPDLLQGGRGTLVPAAEPSELAAGLTRLLREPGQLAEQTARAAEWVESGFDARRVAERWRVLFTEA